MALPGRLAVAGWSAGANVAAVAAQMAKAAGGPALAGQVLITPVTDCDFSRPSYSENAEGYVLTRPLMEWFWNYYADPAERTDPKASPLRAADLSGLPPALVITAQLDPLRDEGDAYAAALSAAGVDVRHLPCAGQTHTSITAVDMVVTSLYAREAAGDALRSYLGVPRQRLRPGRPAPEAWTAVFRLPMPPGQVLLAARTRSRRHGVPFSDYAVQGQVADQGLCWPSGGRLPGTAPCRPGMAVVSGSLGWRGCVERWLAILAAVSLPPFTAGSRSRTAR